MGRTFGGQVFIAHRQRNQVSLQYYESLLLAFENTSDRLKGNSSSPQRIRYYDKELFIRMQAIDATRNELIWSVKIYPNKKKGLTSESIPRVVRDLVRSFERVQFNIDKINLP